MTLRSMGDLQDPPDSRDLRLGLHRSEVLLGDAALPVADQHLLEHAPVVKDQGIFEACFVAGTRVLMEDLTERNIEEIAPGNMVFTHSGKPARVSAASEKKVEGILYHVEVRGYPYPITATPEHPFLVERGGSLQWAPVREVVPGDFVLQPFGGPCGGETQLVRADDWIEDLWHDHGRSRIWHGRRSHSIPSEILLDEKFARLLGLFLAEGSYTRTQDYLGGLCFTFAREEREYQAFVRDVLTEVFGTEAFVIDNKYRDSVSTVVCHNSTLARLFLSLCGRGALKKHVPRLIFKSPVNVRKALLRGWLEGDGTKKKTYPSHRHNGTAVFCTGVTSSEELHRGLLRLAYSCNLRPSGLLRKQAVQQTVASRTVDLYSADVEAVFPDVRSELPATHEFKQRRFKQHELGFLVKVKSVTTTETEGMISVYNLEVDHEDHSYIANGLAVHNCVGFSLRCAGYVVQAVAGESPVEPSAGFVWWNSLKSHGDQGRNQGTYMRNAFHQAKVLGFAPESACPTSELDQRLRLPGSEYDGRPSHEAYREAFDSKFDFDFVRLDADDGEECVRQVKSCIVAGAPVSFGMLVPRSFQSLGSHDVVELWDGDKMVGGHAMCALGYDIRGVLVQNSWGRYWGNAGLCRLSWDFFRSGWVDDKWAIRKLSM